MTQFIFSIILRDYGGRIAATDNHSGPFRCSFNIGVKERLGTLCECRELENTRGPETLG